MKKMTGESTNITEENLSALKQLFPEAFEEGKIDFDVLRQLLGDYVDDEEERYSFKWNGKGRALRLSQTPSTGTLRPCREESVDWDTTQNLYIEGDNLEVLKLLQKSYHGRVKMIYIDPPYNTGSDFVYKDDFRDNVENYKRITGQVDDTGRWIYANKENRESSGRFHTDWLNMMYPRIRLARNLLSEEGAIFISIGDEEICNLLKICTEIFGEDNVITSLVWEKKKKGAFLSKHFINMKEYIVVCTKNSQAFRGLVGEINTDSETYPCIKTTNARGIRTIPKGTPSKYREKDYKIPAGTTISSGNMELTYLDEAIIGNGILQEDVRIDSNWIYQQDTLDEYALAGMLYITQDNYIRRIVLDERVKMLKDLLFRVGNDGCSEKFFSYDVNLNNGGWGTNEDANEELHIILEKQYAFDFAKPTRLIGKLVQTMDLNNEIILDFFSGSGTTASALYQFNQFTKRRNKFILVQIPENLDHNYQYADKSKQTTLENAIAFLDAIQKPHNICEIGKERIRRAGEKVKAECADAERAAALDIGFKVFKLDSSNLQKWQPQTEDLMASLEASMDNFLPDRTALDVVYEIALKLGLDLSYEVEKRKVDDHTVYVIGAGALMICLDSQISMNTAEALLRLHVEYEPETWQVVFRDTGFLSDQEKTNIKETLKSAGLDEDAFISI